MTSFKKFEDIIIWQDSIKFSKNVYVSVRQCKDYSFCDQIKRASISVSNNIAEGYERGSNADFKKFLYISKGSCGEVRSMLYLGLELGYFTREERDVLASEASKLSRMISGLIKKL